MIQIEAYNPATESWILCRRVRTMSRAMQWIRAIYRHFLKNDKYGANTAFRTIILD